MEKNNNTVLQILKRLMIFVPPAGLHEAGDVKKYLMSVLWASLPCLLLAANYFGARIFVMVITAFLAGAAVEVIFGLVRKKPIGGGVFIFSILLVLILPPSIPLWMVALGSAFGILFGKEVFGGTGHHIFPPVLISKGFLMFSYPQAVIGPYFGSMLEFHNAMAWQLCSIVILIGLVVMIFARRSNLLILAGIFISAVLLGIMLKSRGNLPFDSVIKLLAADGFLFGICFLACDPACSPQNNWGKLIYGILIGASAVLMRCFSNYTESMLPAILIGCLFAPTMDAVSSLKNEKGTENERK